MGCGLQLVAVWQLPAWFLSHHHASATDPVPCLAMQTRCHASSASKRQQQQRRSSRLRRSVQRRRPRRLLLLLRGRRLCPGASSCSGAALVFSRCTALNSACCGVCSSLACFCVCEAMHTTLPAPLNMCGSWGAPALGFDCAVADVLPSHAAPPCGRSLWRTSASTGATTPCWPGCPHTLKWRWVSWLAKEGPASMCSWD